MAYEVPVEFLPQQPVLDEGVVLFCAEDGEVGQQVEEAFGTEPWVVLGLQEVPARSMQQHCSWVAGFHRGLYPLEEQSCWCLHLRLWVPRDVG